MDDDGEVERGLRRVLARHGPSIFADNDGLGRQLRFELGDAAFDHEPDVVALLKVVRSGALRDIEVGDLGGAYRTATAANPGIAHESADWAIAALDRVTSGRASPPAARTARSPVTPTVTPTGAPTGSASTEPTRPIGLTAAPTAQLPVTGATSARVSARADDGRAGWPTRAKVLVAITTLVALAAGALAGLLAVRDDPDDGEAAAPVVSAAVTTAATTTTLAPVITTTTVATTVPQTTAATTTTTAPVIAVDQLKGAGPLGSYTLNVLTAACAGLVGCEAFPRTIVASAQDPARLLTAAGTFAIPVAFAGGIGPWSGSGAGAGAGAGIDCGDIAAASWTVTVDVTAAQLTDPPVASSLNYVFRATADPACPTQGRAELTGTMRRTG